MNCTSVRYIGIFIGYMLLLNLVLGSFTAKAGSWINIGPDGESIRVVVVDPTDANTVYAGAWSGVVFKSSDGGATWIYRQLANQSAITAMAIDPSDPDIVYAGEYRDIYKSSDGGMNWSDEMQIDPIAGQISSIAVKPGSSDVLYAGTESGVWKSNNGGASWSQNGLPSLNVTSIVINPTAPDTVYAGVAFTDADNGGVYKTTDGENWGATTLTEKRIYSLAINLTAPNIVYAGSRYFPNLASEGVYKTTDGGSSWTPVKEGLLTYAYYNALAIDPLKPSHIYVGGSEGGTCIGVYRSRSGGSSWSAINNGLGNHCVHDLAIGLGSRTIIYAGTEASVYKIADTPSIAPLELLLFVE